MGREIDRKTFTQASIYTLWVKVFFIFTLRRNDETFKPLKSSCTQRRDDTTFKTKTCED